MGKSGTAAGTFRWKGCIVMKKVLVAEDEQAIREFVVINLKRAGYEAYEASTGKRRWRLMSGRARILM